MCVVAIVGSGPKGYLPDLVTYEAEVDIWIGADLGGIRILNQGIKLDYVVGDFDSVTTEEKEVILEHAINHDVYSEVKNETDLELALNKAYEVKAKKYIYLELRVDGLIMH